MDSGPAVSLYKAFFKRFINKSPHRHFTHQYAFHLRRCTLFDHHEIWQLFPLRCKQKEAEAVLFRRSSNTFKFHYRTKYSIKKESCH